MPNGLNPHIQHLLESIQVSIILPQEVKEMLIKSIEVRELKKGDIVIEEGTHCNELFFLNYGLIRIFYYRDNGDEVTSSFVQENEFFTNVKGFVNETPSSETISIIENSCICSIKKEKYFAIMQKHPIFFYVSHQFINKHRVELEDRIKMLQSLTAKEKYNNFKATYPKLINRVQLSYIASFLGITNETLSRIRK